MESEHVSLQVQVHFVIVMGFSFLPRSLRDDETRMKSEHASLQVQVDCVIAIGFFVFSTVSRGR